MDKVLNLTATPASPEQVADGVIDMPEATRRLVVELLTSAAIPETSEIQNRVRELAELAAFGDWRTDDDTDAVLYDRVLIDGPPWLMRALADALRLQGLQPMVPPDHQLLSLGDLSQTTRAGYSGGWLSDGMTP